MPTVINKRRNSVTVSSGSTSSTTYLDGFRRKYVPSDDNLVREYKRTAYTCGNLNAFAVSDVPLRLYLKSDTANQGSLLQKGIHLRQISGKKIDYLQEQSYLQKTLRRFANIEEVIKHPILDLLDKINNSPFMNKERFFSVGQLFQEFTGKEYWLINYNKILGIPEELWLLPTQWVKPVKLFESNANVIDYYEYTPPGSSEPYRYVPGVDIIPILMPSLENPYIDGVAPLAACFQSNEVNNKLLSHEDNLLENQGRPDAIITPKDTESAFGPDEAMRLQREYTTRFSRGKSGGVWVPTDPLTFTPIPISPRDLARFEINKWSKNDISNAFGVPYALISDNSHNRQQLEAAEVQHAKHAVRPRCNRKAAVLNDQLVPLFDTSGRLFLAYDNPVPEDEAAKLTKITQLKMNGIWTANESRIVEGTFGPSDDPEMDKVTPLNAGLSQTNGSGKRQEARDNGTAEK